MTDDAVIFSLLSPDGDEGYPGNLLASAKFRLGPDGSLNIEYADVTDATTIVNLANHAYFNLGGHDSGKIFID